MSVWVLRNLGSPPLPALWNMNLVRQLGVRVQSMRDPLARGYIEKIDGLSGMIFKDGFHLKVVSDKSIKEAKPSLQELEEFQELDGDGDQTIPNRKKGESFMKGDAVIVTEGDLRNLVGRVEKVELGTVHIKAEMDGLPETVAINQTALQKCFKEGQHVKVVSGSQQGATGMVVKVDQQKQLITILSDAANEAICVFSDHVVESPEVNNGDTMCDSHNLRYRKTPGRSPRFSGGARRHDGQDGFGKGSRVKFRLGPYKGCRGRVVEVKGPNVRVELEPQMKTIVVDRLHCISESGNVAAAVTTPYRSGCETPMPYMRTPMRDPGATSMPYMTTPMRDPGASPMRYMTTPYMMTPRRDSPRATPIHGGMRTPPMTPPSYTNTWWHENSTYDSHERSPSNTDTWWHEDPSYILELDSTFGLSNDGCLVNEVSFVSLVSVFIQLYSTISLDLVISRNK